MRYVLKKNKSPEYNKYIMEDNLLSAKTFGKVQEALDYLENIGEHEKDYTVLNYSRLISI
jgi:hypothetical protein